MNEAQIFHCPTCGAPLDAPQSAETVRCPYCHNTVIVPESMSDADQGIGAAYAQPVTVFASASTLDLSEIKNLLQQNQKIEAIKRVRKATGLGLKESKDLVEALERGDDAEAFSRIFTALIPSGETAGGILEEMTLAQNGQKMEAVKRYYHELELPPNPQGYYFEDVSVAPDGRIAAIANSEDIVVFNPVYQTLMTIPEAVSSVSGDSELDSDIDIDGLGNLYVLGHFNDSAFIYTPDGRLTNRFASEGE